MKKMILELLKTPTILGWVFFGLFIIIGIAYLSAVGDLLLCVISIIILLVLLYLPFATKIHFEKYKEPEEERLLYVTLITISALVISFLLGYSKVIKSAVFGSAIIIIGILPLLISVYARIWQKDKFLSYLFLSISLFVETMIVLVVLFSTFGL
jgi:uncharacterized membrane protein